MNSTRRTNYSPRSVRYLVEGYNALRWMKSTEPGRGLDLLCQLIDVDRAVSRLGPQEYHVLLFCGLLGIPEQEAALALGVHQTTVNRRYQRALEVLAADLNGESGEQA